MSSSVQDGNGGSNHEGATLFVFAYLFVLNFSASLIQGVASFGDAIVIHIMWHAMASATGNLMHQTPLGSSDVEIATLLQYSRTAVLNITMVCLVYRAGARYVPKSLVAAAMLPSVVGTVVGEQMLEVVPHDALKFWFGIGCLVFAVAFVSLKAYKQYHHQRVSSRKAVAAAPSPQEVEEEPSSAVTPTSPSSGAVVPQSPTTRLDHQMDADGGTRHGIQIATAITSLIAGLTGALTGVGGPPWMIFILLFDLPAPFVRLLFPLSTLPSIYTRYAMAFHDGLIRTDMLPYHAVSVAAGLAGLLLGNRVGRRIGPRAFNAVVLVLLVLAAWMMLVDVVLLTTILLFVGIGIVLKVWADERRAMRLQEDSAAGVEDGIVEAGDAPSLPTVKATAGAVADDDCLSSSGDVQLRTVATSSLSETPRFYDDFGNEQPTTAPGHLS